MNLVFEFEALGIFHHQTYKPMEMHFLKYYLFLLLLLTVMNTWGQSLDWNHCFGGSYMDMPRLWGTGSR